MIETPSSDESPQLQAIREEEVANIKAQVEVGCGVFGAAAVRILLSALAAARQETATQATKYENIRTFWMGEVQHYRALVEACGPFVKRGETPAECVARNRADVDTALGLLAKEKAKVAELEAQQATLDALLASLPPSEPAKPEHRCGVRGFAEVAWETGERCPGCVAEGRISVALPPSEDAQGEVCICAAIRFDADGEVFRGHRHDDAILAAGKAGKTRGEIAMSDQGFITSRNRFVSREEGARLQREAGIPSAQTGQPVNDMLFSEDLYLRSTKGHMLPPVATTDRST